MKHVTTQSEHAVPTPDSIGAPVSGAPSDNTTVSAVLSWFEQRGFREQLLPVDGAAFECSGCGERSAATAFEIEAARRFEGASDPDDMVTVLAARCPRCGAVGTVVLGYGPSASDIDADISAALGAMEAHRARTDRSWFGGSGDEEPEAPS